MIQKISYKIRPGDNLYQLSRCYQTTVQAILAQNPNIDPYNLQIGSTIIIYPGNKYIDGLHLSACPNPNLQIALFNQMRETWAQHVYWTRMLIISIVERLNDQNDVTNRLLKNPGDIAKIFAKYYPADTAKAIEGLLTEHLQIGAALITAVRDRDTAQADQLNRRWYANADKMAEAFSNISPYYSYEELQKMLYTHLDLTTQEVVARVSGNYPADINAFDQVEQEAMSMADYFTSGMIRQFPQKFS